MLTIYGMKRCGDESDFDDEVRRFHRVIAMDIGSYAILIGGAIAGGFVSGLAGFGTALTTLALWLCVLPPSAVVPLVLISSVLSQSAALPSIWRTLDFALAWPFVIGGLLGTPLGTILIAYADPRAFKIVIGVLLLVFPPALFFSKPIVLKFKNRLLDGLIGFAGGILGGLAGMSGPLPILWASLRGWSKHERRSVFQIFNWTVLFLALCLQTASGLIDRKVIWIAAITLPATIVSSLLGAHLYHKLNDQHFRDVVLVLLFLSGAALIFSSL